MPRAFLVFLSLVLLLSATACTANTEQTESFASSASDGNNSTERIVSAENVLFDKQQPVKTVTVYGNSGRDAILWQSESAEEAAQVAALFKGWVPEENKVPADMILDLLCDIRVCFDDSLLTVQYSISSTENNCYGSINGIAYYLPNAFGKWLDEKITAHAD